MRIACPIISTGTGSDVYFEILANVMKLHGVKVDVFHVPLVNEFIPFINKSLRKQLSCYDLIHTNIEFATIFNIAGVPLLLTCHHNVLETEYQKYTSITQKVYHQILLKVRIKKALKLTKNIVSVSNSTDQSFRKSFKHFTSQVILNGIDTKVFTNIDDIPREDNKIIIVGSISKRKGSEHINSLLELLPKHIQLTIVTRTLPEQRFNNRVKLIINPTNLELSRLYNKSSVLISLSKIEGFGYTLAESMACGCAVVAWNHSAVKEICSKKHSGQLIAPYNIEKFAQGITLLCNDKNKLSYITKFNIQKSQQEYCAYRMAKEYHKLYSSIIYQK